MELLEGETLSDEKTVSSHLNVVLNFSQELTRRAPPGRQP
jgi:hypothetical protein